MLEGTLDSKPHQSQLHPYPRQGQYKCLSFLVIFTMALVLCHFLLMNKVIQTTLGMMSVGTIFIPFWAFLDDIVAEVYGFKMSMRVFWANMFAIILTQSIFSIFLVKSNAALEFQYHFVLNGISHGELYIWVMLASYLSNRLNSYLLIKWKILLNGRYFWMRSIGSTISSDIWFLILAMPFWISTGPATNMREAILLTMASFVFRIIIYILFAYPSTVIVNILKIIEKINISDEQVKFNPFLRQNNSLTVSG